MRIAPLVVMGVAACLAVRSQQERGSGRGRPAPDIGFTILDSDHDGVLSAAEIAAAPASLAKLDTNADGQLTPDEIRAAMPQGRGRGGRGDGPGEGEKREEGQQAGDAVAETVAMLMSFDAKGDGKLSRTELPERFQGIFDRADENKDGFLTPDEIRKTIAAQAPPVDAGREGGRGPMNFIRMDPVLAAIDTNGDGVISAGEIKNSPAALRKLDVNADGKISREEASVRRGNQ